jgi:hypothetical protein
MLTRRDFVAKLAVAGAALGVVSLAPGARCAEPSANSRRICHEVVSFHMDRPYVDVTGAATPYHPPRGMRSAAQVAHLGDEAFRRICCYV